MPETVIRAVVLDLDGTLLRHEGCVAPLSRQVIAELVARGIMVVVATGRSAALVREVDLPKQVSLLICTNGSSCFSYPDWQLLERSFLDRDLVAGIIYQFRACRYHLHAYYDDGRLVYEYMDADLSQRYAGSLLRISKERVDYSQLDQDRFVKFISYGEPKDLEPVVAPLRRQFGDRLYANYSLPGVMELMSTSVSKLYALEGLLPRYGLSMAQVLAIGDGFNDLGMLEKAAVGVVMGNAHEEIRQQAQQRRFYLAGTNDEDGAAHFLRSWFRLG